MKDSDRYDVIVAGGGVAGVAAAVTSARLGARTLLVERYGFLGGMATAGLVNPFMSTSTSAGKLLVGGFFSEICNRISEMGGMLGRAFDPEVMKFCAQEMVLEAGSDLLLHSWVAGARVAEKEVIGIEVLTKSGPGEVDGTIIIDTTGDADVAAMAGASYEIGNPDEDGMTQAMTLMFTIGGVYVGKALAYAKDNPNEMRFPKPSSDADLEIMLENAIGIAGFYKQVEEARAKGEFPLQQDMVFFISLPTPGQVVVNTTHICGMDGTQAEDLTKAEIEGRRQVMALVKFFRKYIPGFENAYLLQTAAQVGVRETRRVKGEYVFNADDILAGSKFIDAIVRSAYPVDIHSPMGKGYTRDDESTPIAPPPGDWYEVPYRCLVPLEVDDLLVAGRCVSATHEAQGAIRIMPTCMAMGQAAGTAAALCVKEGVTPRTLNTALLRKHLIEQGAII